MCRILFSFSTRITLQWKSISPKSLALNTNSTFRLWEVEPTGHSVKWPPSDERYNLHNGGGGSVWLSKMAACIMVQCSAPYWRFDHVHRKLHCQKTNVSKSMWKVYVGWNGLPLLFSFIADQLHSVKSCTSIARLFFEGQYVDYSAHLSWLHSLRLSKLTGIRHPDVEFIP